MSLQNWLENNQVIQHVPTVAEVRALLGVVDRDLSDALATGLSDDGRFIHAYDAGLLLCKLALHANGYEVQKRAPGHHNLWINSLELTLGLSYRETSNHILRSSKLRHTSQYDAAGIVQKQDAIELLEAAQKLRNDVVEWLRAHHPALLPKGV